MAPIPRPILPPRPPRELPEPRPAPAPYPVHMLGARLSAAAVAVAARTQAPVELVGQHLLTLAAMAAQRLIQIRLPTGGCRPASLYLLTIVGPGERQEAAAKMLVDPFRRWERTREAPRQLYLFTEPRGAGHGSNRFRTHSRMSGFFATAAADLVASQRARHAEAESLIALWDGRKVEPAYGPAYFPRLSTHLVAPPRELFRLLRDRELADAGLLGRVLALYPQSRIGARAWSSMNDAAPPEFETLKAELCRLYKEPATTGTRAITFTAQAKEVWFAFAEEIEAAMAPGGPLAPLSSLAAHLPEQAARLAAVIAFIENPACEELGGDALAKGIGLARYYAAEAMRIAGLAEVDTAASQVTLLQDWLRHARAGQDISLREICRTGPRLVRDVDTAFKTMRKLERLGVVQPKTLAGEGGAVPRGRPAYHWRVTPLVDEMSPNVA